MIHTEIEFIGGPLDGDISDVENSDPRESFPTIEIDGERFLYEIIGGFCFYAGTWSECALEYGWEIP